MPHLAEMTRKQVADLAAHGVAVLPIGSLEQHGDHLPLGTDSLLVEEVVERALADRAETALCPPLPYGFSGHHQFAVALSLPPRTLLDVLGALLDSLVAAGFRRILVVNGHGGNIEMMSQAVKIAALEHEILAACCSYWELLEPRPGAPGHAGSFETSLMETAHPSLVRPPMDGPRELPLFDRRVVRGLHVERHGEWQRTGGITDDPGLADAAAGAAALAEAAARLTECVDALLDLDLPSDAPPPSTPEGAAR